ncbi:hypothetical protein [Picosynechococcus sp. PCC 73109]|uniref:hypothetical protein n=1 Tax=Picosynechococcus sp. PCC 73109 TaxID=374982 RepID=UPI0007458DEB|nr:hypothetical protein [Picosynechococcus sp. PCC 73109]AMA10843.1 hypothetical protein AWQ23_15540 [Picosynechococcus sp. PCC 73109]
MRLPVDVWQRRDTTWQAAFIRENLLSLGHEAWQGYLTQGRGLVVCEVAAPDLTCLNWRQAVVPYYLHYRPAAIVYPYLKSRGLPSDVLDHLLKVLQTYTPEREMLLVLNHGVAVEVDWLQNLAIAPPDCYRQIGDRWEEFNLTLESVRRRQSGEP